MEYTKGNWERYNAPNGEHIWCEDKHIADFDGENANANAKLCMSAPDMYEALKEAKLQIEYLHEKFKVTGSGNQVLAKIESVLNEAEGK